MICKWCNKEVQNNSQFCVHCGKELNDNINHLDSNMVGENQSVMSTNSNEKVNIGLVILSWFIPLVGLILFLTNRKEKSKTAKACGICALVSFILNFIIIIVFFAFGFYLIFDNIKDVNNQTGIYNDDKIIVDNDEEADANDSGNDDVIVGDVTSDWKKYEVSINGTNISLPLTYDKLSKMTGFTYKSPYLKSYLEGGYYTNLNMYDNDKLALYVDVLNDTKNDLLYTDCKITRISQTKYQLSNTDVVVIFPGGLRAGQKITEAEIISLFGNPDDTSEYSSEGYETKTYKYLEDSRYTTLNKYEIRVVNGVIDELELNKRY